MAGLSVVLLAGIGNAWQSTPNRDPEREVLASLRAQPIGRHTLADLSLPEDFLRREVDRIIRASFEERYRVVVKDAAAITEDGHAPAPAILRARQAKAGAIAIFEPALTPETLAYRKSFPRARPSNRGFKPTLDSDGGVHWPMHEPADTATREIRLAADHVARHLAHDGLIATLVYVLAHLEPSTFVPLEPSDLQLLRETGMPIDLLESFVLEEIAGGEALIVFIASALVDGQDPQSLINDLKSCVQFRFQATQPGFQMIDDSGGLDPAAFRVQVTRGGYWRGIGDGATTDLIRQAIASFPDARWFASVHVEQARDFAEIAATWPTLQHPDQLTMVIEPLEVQQWTQDNAKVGLVGGQRLGMIVPRFASWGDDGSTFVPGEMFLLPGVAAAMGAELIHSPLLFQGGNLICVDDPHSGGLLLLISESDVYRNTALGLTREQVIEAFRVEFGCARCVMLPSVSFHLDYDVSVRTHGDRMIAMVNDPTAAAKIVLECGSRALERAGIVNADTVGVAVDALKRDDRRGFAQHIAPVIMALGPDGRFPLSLAEHFATTPMDSGVGNLHRFLLALDFVISLDLRSEEWPNDRLARSYLHSLQRRNRDRQSLHHHLQSLGMELQPIPSMSDTSRGFAFLNGIHTRTSFIVPTYGGLYERLDVAALDAFRNALGDEVRLVPIQCSESQRRSGAVRCSLAAFPALAASKHESVPDQSFR